MSEYTNVEHPFLEKLREIGWQVIDKEIAAEEKILEKYENMGMGLTKRMLNVK